MDGWMGRDSERERWHAPLTQFANMSLLNSHVTAIDGERDKPRAHRTSSRHKHSKAEYPTKMQDSSSKSHPPPPPSRSRPRQDPTSRGEKHHSTDDDDDDAARKSNCSCIILRFLCSRCRFCSGMRLVPCPRGKRRGSLCANCKSRDEFEPGCGERCRARVEAIRVELSASGLDAVGSVRSSSRRRRQRRGALPPAPPPLHRHQQQQQTSTVVLPRRPEELPPQPTSPSDSSSSSSSLYSQASLPRRP
ncbi:hypothetical protein L249_0854 [Ophiocordyceps polyrhachis-furcata BCC 54312]|uniref:Uncharacterized protein n=1 Tax=Ophiocordyceps polyrhachis-furcata BCC 54312 TaxID=1330021 RepID=A0A367LE74_9HYPO|nr:hypothetical protein L249_0854 [Ophiocordyceps polyrhachis-furcata BCC 54312]